MMADGPGSAGDRLVCIGVIAGAHGVRGIARVKSFTANPDDVCRYGPVCDDTRQRVWRLQPVGRTRGVVLVRLDGIDDRDAVEALKGIRLHIPRSALPAPDDDDDYYHADLIGLAAELTDGTPIGRVTAVHDHGAGDILEITRSRAAALDVPFTRTAVPVVDLPAGRVVIDLVPGLAGPVPVDAGGGDDGGGDEDGTGTEGSRTGRQPAGMAGEEDGGDAVGSGDRRRD